MTPGQQRWSAGLAGLLLLLAPDAARAQAEPATTGEIAAPQRPAILPQRWQEDWSALANPALRTGPFDDAKYIPLSTDGAYLSLGANLRERVETLDAAQFGTAGQKSNTYLLDRFQVDADLHLDGWQAFVQLEDDRAPGKIVATPADSDRLDLEQAFVAHVGQVGDGTLKLRIGRQEFGFDQQRFVSAREGPNVRQAYDALWADYEIGDWRLISFASHPTQTRDGAVFDDYSTPNLTLDGFRIERRSLGPGDLAVYYLRYQRSEARFPDASGDEQRNAVDVHYSGKVGAVDFDAEIMGQQGAVGGRPVLAWAFGQRTGYTFANVAWTPHLSLEFDAASGNSSRTGTYGTFNPLFPNGYYFTLAGLTGYSNLLHLKPIVSFAPSPTLLLQVAAGFQWRETTKDAIYTFPMQPIPNTIGHGSLWSAAYLQVDAAKKVNDNLTISAEIVRYQVGAAIREAGGRDASYAEFQLSIAW